MSCNGNYESPCLLIDASGMCVRVGILDSGLWVLYKSSESQALESLFELVKSVLQETGLTLEDINSFGFCEGPGSVLSIRLAAMMLRTWQVIPAHSTKKIYGYKSLEAAEAMLIKDKKLQGTYAIITDSRMKKWNLLIRKSADQTSEIQEVDNEFIKELNCPCYYFSQRNVEVAPEGVKPFEYNLGHHPSIFNEIPMRILDNPDAWLPVNTDYKKWSAQRHQAVAISKEL